MTDEERDIIQKRLNAHLEADAVGARAATEPFPGPLRDAFSPQPDIRVGPYTVRAMCDADYEYFSWLKHPLAQLDLKSVIRQEQGDTDAKFEAVLGGILPTGPGIWQMAWIMTRSIEVCDEQFTKHGADSVRQAARLEFGKLQSSALTALYVACVKQFSTYWSTVLEYGAASEPAGEDGEEAKRTIPFVRSGQLKTGSVG